MSNIVCSNFDSLGACKSIELLLQWKIFSLSYFLKKREFNMEDIVNDLFFEKKGIQYGRYSQ